MSGSGAISAMQNSTEMAVVDLAGRRDRPLSVHFFFIFMQF